MDFGFWLEVKVWVWVVVEVVLVKFGYWDSKIDEFVNEINTGEDFNNVIDEVRGFTEVED